MYCFVFLQVIDRSTVQSCLVSSSNWFVHPNWKLVYKHETPYNVNYRSASLKPLKRQPFSLLSVLRSKQTNRQTKTNLFWSFVAVDVESKFHQQWPPFWKLVPVLLVSVACPRVEEILDGGEGRGRRELSPFFASIFPLFPRNAWYSGYYRKMWHL